MSIQFLPCPFCGNAPKYVHRNSFHQIHCAQLGCAIVEVTEDTYEEAAKRWSRRALPPNQPSEGE